MLPGIDDAQRGRDDEPLAHAVVAVGDHKQTCHTRIDRQSRHRFAVRREQRRRGVLDYRQRVSELGMAERGRDWILG